MTLSCFERVTVLTSDESCLYPSGASIAPSGISTEAFMRKNRIRIKQRPQYPDEGDIAGTYCFYSQTLPRGARRTVSQLSNCVPNCPALA